MSWNGLCSMHTKTTSKGKIAELQLRADVYRELHEFWVMTWHEDREISPGVPDVSYVMRFHVNPGYETGWLELKAELEPKEGGTVKFKVRPSQHDWTERYLGLVPIHYLCALGTTWYLIDGVHHKKLAEPQSHESLRGLAVATITKNPSRGATLARYLQKATWRLRGGTA